MCLISVGTSNTRFTVEYLIWTIITNLCFNSIASKLYLLDYYVVNVLTFGQWATAAIISECNNNNPLSLQKKICHASEGGEYDTCIFWPAKSGLGFYLISRNFYIGKLAFPLKASFWFSSIKHRLENLSTWWAKIKFRFGLS